jgi:hypothetical protein
VGVAAALLVTGSLIFWRSQKEVLVPTPSEGTIESPAQKENLVLAPTTLISPRPSGTAQDKGQAVVESSSLVVSGGGRDLYRVYDSSGQKQLGSKFTGQLIDLLPGTYQIQLNETRQKVTVQANQKALVESGSLIVSGNGRDLYRVYDSSGQKQLGSKFTGQLIDLLPGSYHVDLHQSRVPVQVRAKEKTTL